MTKGKWIARTTKGLTMGMATGTILLATGTSCGTEIRDAAISAGATFVGTSIGTILENLIPVGSLFNQNSSGSTST